MEKVNDNPLKSISKKSENSNSFRSEISSLDSQARRVNNLLHKFKIIQAGEIDEDQSDEEAKF